jgi:hypothetical protein
MPDTPASKDLTRKYLQKLLKMPSWKVWVERPSGLLKEGEKHKPFD